MGCIKILNPHLNGLHKNPEASAEWIAYQHLQTIQMSKSLSAWYAAHHLACSLLTGMPMRALLHAWCQASAIAILLTLCLRHTFKLFPLAGH